MMTRYVFVTLTAGVLLSCLSGCNRRSNKPDGFPALYPCEITIKVNGVPLEGANVKLNSPDARWPPGGVTNAQGIAKINTYTHPGAPEGEYKVLVSKYDIPEALGKGTDVLQEGPPAKPLLQQKFRLPASTPLNCTVTKAGPNRFEFTVE
jgi:hypothetical protein